MATAIGAALARPDRLPVTALGDGGALMGVSELETVVRLGLPMVVVVYDDRAYGAEVHHFGPGGGDLGTASDGGRGGWGKPSAGTDGPVGTGVSVTWWGHATATVVDRGVRVLTDPVLTPGLAHLRRRRGPTPAPEAARADVVLVSHLHADHLHLASLALVDPAAPVVVPAGAPEQVPGLRRLRRELVELAPGEAFTVGGLRITAVPAAHDGRRWPWSRERVRPLGYVLDGDARTWFGGDTDLYDGLAEATGPVDLALVPVGGWGPTLGAGHLDPERAAQAVAAVGARTAVPIHFGTLWPIGLDRVRPELFLPPGAAFAAAVGSRGGATAVRELAPGGGTSL